MPKPNRHHDVIRLIVNQTGVQYVDAHGEDQGFLDQSGTYLNRKQAFVSAEANNQLRPTEPIRYNQLYSENLW